MTWHKQKCDLELRTTIYVWLDNVKVLSQLEGLYHTYNKLCIAAKRDKNVAFTGLTILKR